MPNRSGEDRRGVICGWHNSKVSTGLAGGPPWEAMLRKLQDAGRLHQRTRRVLGLPDVGLPAAVE
jgi:hypothetical protein